MRLANRVIDLRTNAAQSTFRIQSGVGRAFREFLNSKGFIEIHTPKLQGGATESGASVFEVNYFGRPTFLAQSPQLAKQMAIASDFGRVYEVGPVFRAENSNTHRHMTEFIGLDIEMAIHEHYHEALHVIDGVFKSIFHTIYTHYRPEVDAIKRYFPHEDLAWLDSTPIIPFTEGLQMLFESGFVEENGQPPKYEDLSRAAELRLGQLVKAKFNTDYYILDKFPASARPFYTMPDPTDSRASNSFDIFIRGQEVVSGAQRIHNPEMLRENMKKKGVKIGAGMEEYLQAFEWGAPPHAGAGIGLERVVFLTLDLGDIRYASWFPRDPKSFPVQATKVEPPHPEADTLKFRISLPEGGMASLADDDKLFPSLGKMIANYGDASNTSWLDDRYQVWRHSDTGAAVGWSPMHGYAIVIGNPLCDESQYFTVISAFLKFLKTQNLRPLWLLVGPEVEAVLAEKLGWSCFSCVAEERVMDPGRNPAKENPDVVRKVRHAKKEGVRIVDVPANEGVPEDIKAKIEIRMNDWKANRKGQQAVSTFNAYFMIRYLQNLSISPNSTHGGIPNIVATSTPKTAMAPSVPWS
jgi:ergosteryl-3beta-O-L-aspartate synthase